MIFHILHTGHSDEGRSPPVHCLQLHVDQEAVGRALQEPSQGEQGSASGSRPLSSFLSTVSSSGPAPSPGLAREEPSQLTVPTGESKNRLPAFELSLTRCAPGKKVSKRHILGIYIATTLGWTQLLLVQLETKTNQANLNYFPSLSSCLAEGMVILLIFDSFELFAQDSPDFRTLSVDPKPKPVAGEYGTSLGLSQKQRPDNEENPNSCPGGIEQMM